MTGTPRPMSRTPKARGSESLSSSLPRIIRYLRDYPVFLFFIVVIIALLVGFSRCQDTIGFLVFASMVLISGVFAVFLDIKHREAERSRRISAELTQDKLKQSLREVVADKLEGKDQG